MYSLDGQSGHISVSSKAGKMQVIYAKPSSTTSMETHWEETQQPEKKWDKRKTDYEADDSESELLAIPESDVSDSTLQGSVQVTCCNSQSSPFLNYLLQDSFEEAIDETCYPLQAKSEKACVTKAQDHYENIAKKELFLSHGVHRSSSEKRPTWFIGSEEESLKPSENKKWELPEKPKLEPQNSLPSHHKWFSTDHSKNCSKMTALGTSSLASTLAVVAGVPNIQMAMAKTVTTDSHRQVTSTSVEAQHISKPMPLGKHKRIIEPSITPVCTPVSDCDDCFKNNQTHPMLPAPSLERLLPIGATRSPGTVIDIQIKYIL